MTRRRILATGIAAAAVAATAAVVSSTAGSATMTELTVIVNDAEGTIVPADYFEAPAANAQGIENAPVYRDGEAVGEAQTVFTFTSADGDDVAGLLECSIELPEGNLFFNGSFHAADLFTGVDFPVVGGTGEYAGVTGTVTGVVSEDGAETTMTFHLGDR